MYQVHSVGQGLDLPLVHVYKIFAPLKNVTVRV